MSTIRLHSPLEVARQLRLARKARGLTQAALGRRMRVPQSYISTIEQGKTDLRLSSLLEIARLLDLEVTLVPRKHALLVRRMIGAMAGDQQATSAGGEDLSQTPMYRLK